MQFSYYLGDKQFSIDGLEDIEITYKSSFLSQKPLPVKAVCLFNIADGYSENLEALLDLVMDSGVNMRFTVSKKDRSAPCDSRFTGRPFMWGVTQLTGNVCKVEIEINGY